MPYSKPKLFFKFAIIACMAMLSAPSYAQNAPIDIVPAHSLQERNITLPDAEDTHPPLKLTPDKSELIRLDKKAGSIIIGNPDHLSILADTAQTLVLVPKLPGATYVTILDMDGNLIMQRHILVASPKEKYVRIRKSCASGQEGCQPTKVFFCPDMCHEVAISSEESSASPAAEGAAAATQTVSSITSPQDTIPPEENN